MDIRGRSRSPLFRLEVERHRRIPVSFTLRFVRNARNVDLEPNTILHLLARQFRETFLNSIIPPLFPGRNRQDMLERVTGNIRMRSLNTDRSITFENLRATHITYERLLEIYNRIVQSNTSNHEASVDLAYSEWEFVIDPHLLPTGRGGIVNSQYRSNTYSFTYKEYRDYKGPINCAALAISYRMNKPKYRSNTPQDRILKHARELQDQLGWGLDVSVTELETFVQKYPEYRISCLTDAQMTNFRTFTFQGSKFDESVLDNEKGITTVNSKVIYLVLDLSERHYYAIASPAMFFRATKKSDNYRFCHKCVELYLYTTTTHSCEEGPSRKRRKRKCEYCGSTSARKCDCSMEKCMQCRAGYLNGEHRCLVTRLNTSEFTFGSSSDGSEYSLWAYDLESRMQIIESKKEMICTFEKDGYQFTGEVITKEHQVTQHKANLVVARNVFTDEEKIFHGDTCLEDFLHFTIGYNKGKNVFVAHNASGYDSRLLFDALVRMEIGKNPDAIFRGRKILSITIGKTKFLDSMLHTPGSLKALAKSYCKKVHLEKGYFPHLFNTIENYDYRGPIPSPEYFDLSFVAKTKEDIEEFEVWHSTWEGRRDWCFKDELIKYCRNDVLVLANIMKGYHELQMETFGKTPWAYTTAPSYIHAMVLFEVAKNYELPDPKEDPNGYAATITDLAENKAWCVLTKAEYTFVREALRGGRTEIRRPYRTLSKEEWDQGLRIRYQDICSQYPYQQAVHDFPVGCPRIYVWDNSCFPCSTCKVLECDCLQPHKDKRIIMETCDEPGKEELLKEEWFGFVCASLIPPKDLYHPVLVHFDKIRKKSIASLEPIVKQVFTSVEFQQALKMGYKIVKIHRFDKYKKAPSLWEPTIKKLYLKKMCSSADLPSPEEQIRLRDAYEERFEMGDMLEESFQKQMWEKDDAKKFTSKINVNCGWGKHAQRPDMTESILVGGGEDKCIDSVIDNISGGYHQLKDCIVVGNYVKYDYQKTHTSEYDLHDSYLPAACFVPAYGRMQLWEQLNKLGKRVMMNDTDSIIYLYDPKQYNIPEGDIWGDWEVEGIDKKNGGIRTFVGLGPKTYAIKCDNGTTSVKCKGLALKYSTTGIVNFASMEHIIKMYLQDEIRIRLKVPQMTFKYDFHNGISTQYILKELGFNSNDLKGVLDDEGHLCPFGYE